MKGVVGIAAAMLALTVGVAATASASGATHAVAAKHKHKKKKRKCKKGRVFVRGRCRGVGPPMFPTGPHSLVRGQLSWDGPASLSLVVADSEGRQATDSSDQIPDTDFQVLGGPGHYTEVFTDHLVYSVTTTAGPFTREFTYTTCFGGSGGGTSHVDFTWVTASGLVNHSAWTITPLAPPGDPEPTGCATWIN
jgi:hypothetical protein